MKYQRMQEAGYGYQPVPVPSPHFVFIRFKFYILPHILSSSLERSLVVPVEIQLTRRKFDITQSKVVDYL
jgi:hypothetical protein